MRSKQPGVKASIEEYNVRIIRLPSNGVALSESWYVGTKQHREGDLPAHVERDVETGLPVFEVWYKNNLLDRSNGPAVIRRHPDTGRITFSEWYREGVKISPPKGYRPNKLSRPTPGP